MKCEECTRAGRETFLESKYRKTGSKARKEVLFPELEKEICQARKELDKPAKWPNQDVDEFKDEIVKQSAEKIGKQLTQSSGAHLLIASCEHSRSAFGSRVASLRGLRALRHTLSLCRAPCLRSNSLCRSAHSIK